MNLETDGTFQEQEPVSLNKRLHSALFDNRNNP